jgi:hypothetical protein
MKRIFYLMILGLMACAIQLAGQVRPRLTIETGWSVVVHTDDAFKRSYQTSSMSPFLRSEFRLVDNFYAYGHVDYYIEDGNTDPSGYESKIKLLHLELGGGYRIPLNRFTIALYGGANQIRFKETALGKAYKNHSNGYSVGAKVYFYFSGKTFMSFNGNYIRSRFAGPLSEIELGGFRFYVGLGTHIKIFESSYSEE